MNAEEREELNRDLFNYTLKTLTQKQQFDQWLNIFFYINRSLHLEYDSVYQSSFYIKLYELLTEGLEYAKDLREHVKKVHNNDVEVWLDALINGLTELKKGISKNEFNYIQYKRHNTCHIFQNGYEIQINDSYEAKRNSRFKLKDQFYQILDRHGSDQNFDLYLTKKLYPIIISIFNQLKELE